MATEEIISRNGVETRQTGATVEDRLSAIRAQFDTAFTLGVVDDALTGPDSITEAVD